LAGAAATASRAAGGRVTRDRAAGDGERTRTKRRIALVVEAAAEAVAPITAGPAGAADGLITRHCAVSDRERRAQEIGNGAAQAAGLFLARGPGAADGLVFLDDAVAQGQHSCAPVIQRPADAVAGQGNARIAGPANGLVVGERQAAGGQVGANT